jgi:hypothetical protein
MIVEQDQRSQQAGSVKLSSPDAVFQRSLSAQGRGYYGTKKVPG